MKTGIDGVRERALRARAVLLAAGVAAIASTAAADPPAPESGWVDPLLGGTVSLSLNARYELADLDDGTSIGHAATLRTALGYRTKPWHGLSGFVEVENVASPASAEYFDGVGTPTGEGLVPDPETTEINQVYLDVAPEFLGKSLIRVGRQQIKLDDDRFIGNVGWRQNYQTFDAALAKSSFGVEGLDVSYTYIYDVRRIFGDKGGPATRDFDSDSHLARASYRVAPWLEPVLFAYLLDFSNSPGNSSNTYGLRLTGTIPLCEVWSLAYQASYAHQTDGGSGRGENPVDYDAEYVLADAGLGYAPLGTIGVGYELLGSDGGIARVVTPLSTAHAFNGWADSFLNNGGNRGLQDLYAYVAPKLPFGIAGKLVYHEFWSDYGSDDLGREIDAILTRKFGAHVTLLAKFAYYDEGDDPVSPFARTRFWLQATYAF